MFGDRRVLVGCFIASVLINLFLAGVLTGRFLFEPKPPTQPQAAAVMRPGAIRELPEEERLRYNVIMAAQGPALRAGRLKLRALRQAVRDAIAAPHYDAALVSRRFAELRAAQTAQQTLQQNAMSQALGQLSAQSRASVIQAETDTADNRAANNGNAGR
ncbi:MAG TPA: periplasmic heavy metal sensor [Rhizomicrobium sp.]|nr:periplasmic heavy metal sensor [Rhizomicrobium sp.]